MQLGEPEQRLGVADARRVHDRRELGRLARAEVAVEDDREQVEPVDALAPHRAATRLHLAGERLRGQAVGDRHDVARVLLAVAAPGGAVVRQRPRHLLEHVRVPRVCLVRRHHRPEQQPVDVLREPERVRHRELRPVRDAVDADLVEAQRLPDGIEVGRVLGRAVERSGRSEPVAAGRRGCYLRSRRERDLERRAVDQAGAAGAAVVVGDECVAREHELEGGVRVGVAETEAVRRPLARAACDEEDHALRRPGGGQLLDVQRDRAGHGARAIERDGDLGADERRDLPAVAGLVRRPDQAAHEPAGRLRGQHAREALRGGGAPGACAEPEDHGDRGRRDGCSSERSLRPCPHEHAHSSRHTAEGTLRISTQSSPARCHSVTPTSIPPDQTRAVNDSGGGVSTCASLLPYWC